MSWDDAITELRRFHTNDALFIELEKEHRFRVRYGDGVVIDGIPSHMRLGIARLLQQYAQAARHRSNWDAERKGKRSQARAVDVVLANLEEGLGRVDLLQVSADHHPDDRKIPAIDRLTGREKSALQLELEDLRARLASDELRKPAKSPERDTLVEKLVNLFEGLGQDPTQYGFGSEFIRFALTILASCPRQLKHEANLTEETLKKILARIYPEELRSAWIGAADHSIEASAALPSPMALRYSGMAITAESTQSQRRLRGSGESLPLDCIPSTTDIDD